MIWIFLGSTVLILQRLLFYGENPFYLSSLFLFSFWLFLLIFKVSNKRIFSFLLVILIFLLAENIRGEFEKNSFLAVVSISLPTVFVRNAEGFLNFITLSLPKNLIWLEFSISLCLTFLLFFLNNDPKPSLPLLTLIGIYSYVKGGENFPLWNGIVGNLIILSFPQEFHTLIFSLFIFWLIRSVAIRSFPISIILGLGLGLIFSRLV